jgi:hypothetical protein
MPTPTSDVVLAKEFKRANKRLTAATVRALVALWDGSPTDDLAGVAAWIESVLPLVRQAEASEKPADAEGPGFARPDLESAYVAPRTEVERTLVGFWSELLGVAEVGVEDDFFALGGHSLIAVRLFAMIRHTHRTHPQGTVVAYSDNAAVMEGHRVEAFLPAAGLVIGELASGAVPTAGTTVAGDTTKATATTGDVRGTYAPNGTPNGTLSFQLLVALDNPGNRGVAQF